MKKDTSCHDGLIVLIDSFRGWELPNIEDCVYENDIYMKKEDLTELFSKREAGIYVMKNPEYEDFDGQMGDFGRFEIEPYNIISSADMVKIGSVESDYKTEMTIKELEKDKLKLKAKELQEFVSRQNKDDKAYVLYSPWGYQLELAEKNKNNDAFLITSTIKKYDLKLTEENLEYIEKDLKEYFK